MSYMRRMLAGRCPVTDKSTLHPLLLSERETAKLLGVCPKTIYTLTRQGKLQAVRIGCSVRYDIRDIEAFVAAAKSQGGAV